MKKVLFYKTMSGGANKPPKIETGTGYKQIYAVLGTDREISLIFEKRAYDWSITEERSGLLILCNFSTRKAAAEAVTPELITRIYERLPSCNKYITMVNIERGKREDITA